MNYSHTDSSENYNNSERITVKYLFVWSTILRKLGNNFHTFQIFLKYHTKLKKYYF